jgi:hypothetical protein
MPIPIRHFLDCYAGSRPTAFPSPLFYMYELHDRLAHPESPSASNLIHELFRASFRAELEDCILHVEQWHEPRA